MQGIFVDTHGNVFLDQFIALQMKGDNFVCIYIALSRRT